MKLSSFVLIQKMECDTSYMVSKTDFSKIGDTAPQKKRLFWCRKTYLMQFILYKK